MEADVSSNWTRTFRSQWKKRKYPVNLQNKNLLSVWLCNWEDKSSSLQWIRKQYFAYLLRNSQNWLKKFRFHRHFHFSKKIFWPSRSSPGDNCAALYRCVQELVAKSTRLQVHQNCFRSESAQAELPANAAEPQWSRKVSPGGLEVVPLNNWSADCFIKYFRCLSGFNGLKLDGGDEEEAKKRKKEKKNHLI